MKPLKLPCITVLLIVLSITGHTQTGGTGAQTNDNNLPLYKADNNYYQYFGRIDFSNPALPKFWSPGVYIKARFRGTECQVVVNDEELAGNHNYLEIVIDDKKFFRIQTTGKTNTIKAAGGLSDDDHTITICKNTEAGNGFLEFAGLRCKALLPPGEKPLRKIEFIGNSITAGMGSDLATIPCDKGQWYDQHNAYLSYGAITARDLKAQWQLTAVSGIGLVRSCCNMDITMPQVFDKMNLRANTGSWNFEKYQPQIVTICLGQNDGVQDSAKFCTAYVDFIAYVRKRYPEADIVCLTSPMGSATLTSALKKYITSVVKYMNDDKGDIKVTKYFFSKRYNHGCGDHPDLKDHQEIAAELTGYLKKLKGW